MEIGAHVSSAGGIHTALQHGAWAGDDIGSARDAGRAACGDR